MFNLFHESEVLEKLTNLGDPLEKINDLIDWELFRPLLNQLLEKDRSKGGRKPFDYVLMFKILLIKRTYNLSYDQTEFQILDRRSFKRFLGIKEAFDTVPDAKTIWHFENQLAQEEGGQGLFSLFTNQLEGLGLIANEGTIVDASFVEVPKQRNSKDENDQIKQGKTPKEWSESKRQQKDPDARWTKKGNTNYFGYKSHAAVDRKSKLIKTFRVTTANVHDSQVYEGLLSLKDKDVWADSAYIGQELPVGINQHVIERAYRNHPLTDEQKALNREKSRIRCRVEHPFGFIENSMHGSTCRNIGKVRVELNVSLTNLLYNIYRTSQIIRLHLMDWDSCAQI